MAPRRKKETAPAEVKPPDVVASTDAPSPSPSGLTVTSQEGKNTLSTKNISGKQMSDQEELGSVIDFSDNIEDAEAPLPLPPGNYDAIIKGAEAKVSGNDKRYAAIQFYISPDSYPADYPIEEAPDGLTITYRRLSLENTKASRFHLKRFMQNIGAPPAGKSVDLSQWTNLNAKVSVKHEEYEGVTRAVIERVLASA